MSNSRSKHRYRYRHNAGFTRIEFGRKTVIMSSSFHSILKECESNQLFTILHLPAEIFYIPLITKALYTYSHKVPTTSRERSRLKPSAHSLWRVMSTISIVSLYLPHPSSLLNGRHARCYSSYYTRRFRWLDLDCYSDFIEIRLVLIM